MEEARERAPLWHSGHGIAWEGPTESTEPLRLLRRCAVDVLLELRREGRMETGASVSRPLQRRGEGSAAPNAPRAPPFVVVGVAIYRWAANGPAGPDVHRLPRHHTHSDPPPLALSLIVRTNLRRNLCERREKRIVQFTLFIFQTFQASFIAIKMFPSQQGGMTCSDDTIP